MIISGTNISGSRVYSTYIPPITYGELLTWGLNNFGQLADNTRTNRSSPVQTVAGGTTWQNISFGYTMYTVAGIKTDGTLWTWGWNNYGTLGDGTITSKSSPVQTVAGGTTWQSISMGAFAAAAIKTDGTLWTWGYNNNGQLGDNTITSKSSPVQTVAGGTTWSKVATGYHTSAIKNDGTLWMWGNNSNGQLGDNTITSKSSPVQTVAGGTNWQQSSNGRYFTSAIKNDGTLWSWGDNSYGQLGDNTRTNRSSPVQTIAAGSNWSQVAVGLNHTLATKTDGTLWTWGNNAYGGLGDGTTTHKSSPVQISGGGTTWNNKIAAGTRYSGAIKTDGTLWVWGENGQGQIGDGTRTQSTVPVQVGLLTTWQQLSLGVSHTTAIKTVV